MILAPPQKKHSQGLLTHISKMCPVHCQLSPQCLVIMILFILAHNTFTLASFSFLPSSPVLVFCAVRRVTHTHTQDTISQFFYSLPFSLYKPHASFVKFSSPDTALLQGVACLLVSHTCLYMPSAWLTKGT